MSKSFGSRSKDTKKFTERIERRVGFFFVEIRPPSPKNAERFKPRQLVVLGLDCYPSVFMRQCKPRMRLSRILLTEGYKEFHCSIMIIFGGFSEFQHSSRIIGF